MHDVIRVHVLQRLSNVNGHLYASQPAERCQLILQLAMKIAASYKLRYDEQAGFILTQALELDHAWMVNGSSFKRLISLEICNSIQ